MTSRDAETFKVPVKGKGRAPSNYDKGAFQSPHTRLGGGVCQNTDEKLRFTIHASILATLCALGLCDISDGHCAEHTFILNIESMAGKGLCVATLCALSLCDISDRLCAGYAFILNIESMAGKGLSR